MTISGYIYIISKHKYVSRVNPTPRKSFGAANIPYSKIWFYGSYNVPVFVNIVGFSASRRIIDAISIITEDSNVIYMSDYNIFFSYGVSLNGVLFTKIHKIFAYGIFMYPTASGQIQGQIRNQFYMDEDVSSGVLRTATSGNNYNNVYCLDRYLNVIGSALNWGQYYTISATRFIGQRLYLILYKS